MERLNADLRMCRAFRTALFLIAPLLATSCQSSKPQPLGLPLRGFEEQVLADACKLESTVQIGDGIFKGDSLQVYNCGGVLRHEVVTDGNRIFKYASILNAVVLKDPGVIARKQDVVMLMNAWGALYMAARNLPKENLYNVLKEKDKETSGSFLEIPLDKWKKAIELGIPTSSTVDGYTYSCTFEDGDIVRFGVAPEATYLKEKSARIRGASGENSAAAASGHQGPPHALGVTLDRLGSYFMEMKFTRADKVSSGLFKGYDRRVYERHAGRKGASRIDVELTVYSQGQNVYKIQTAEPRTQYLNNDGTPTEYFMYQVLFAPFYAAATDTNLQQVTSRTLFGRMSDAVGKSVSPAEQLAQMPTAPWEMPSLKWAGQCASLVKDRATGTRVIKIAGFAYSCRIGTNVQFEVVSENALED